MHRCPTRIADEIAAIACDLTKGDKEISQDQKILTRFRNMALFYSKNMRSKANLLRKQLKIAETPKISAKSPIRNDKPHLNEREVLNVHENHSPDLTCDETMSQMIQYSLNIPKIEISGLGTTFSNKIENNSTENRRISFNSPNTLLSPAPVVVSPPVNIPFDFGLQKQNRTVEMFQTEGINPARNIENRNNSRNGSNFNPLNLSLFSISPTVPDEDDDQDQDPKNTNFVFEE